MTLEYPSRQWTTRLLAHDLTNALAVAILNIDMLLEGESGFSSSVSSTLQRTLKSLLSMQEMVSEILSYEQQHDYGINQPSCINVNELVSKSLQICINQSGTDRQRLHFDQIAPDLFIQGHEVLLRQAILNILNNAINHSEPDSQIHIKVLEQSEHCVIQVQDDGSGMDSEMQMTMFDSSSRGQEGSPFGHGLGLSLVKWIAAKHNGDVLVDSEPGKGTTVQLQFLHRRPCPKQTFPPPIFS